MSDFKINNNDLVLSATSDIAIGLEMKQIVFNDILENMDMVLADDIDFPTIHSKQMKFLNSDELSSNDERLQDVERILENHPIIDDTQIEVEYDEVTKQVKIDFELKPRAEVEQFIMS
jgi:hypothetical protein